MKPGSPAADSHPVYEAEDPHLAKRKFLDDAAEKVRDTGHRAFIRKALGGYYTNRDTQQARYRDWEQARDAASLAKWSAVNRLDELLPKFVAAFEANGGQVHWARNADEAPRCQDQCASGRNQRTDYRHGAHNAISKPS